MEKHASQSAIRDLKLGDREYHSSRLRHDILLVTYPETRGILRSTAPFQLVAVYIEVLNIYVRRKKHSTCISGRDRSKTNKSRTCRNCRARTVYVLIRVFSSDRIEQKDPSSRKISRAGITKAGYSKTRRVPCPRGRKTGLRAAVDRSPFKSVIYLADGNYIDSKSGTRRLRTPEDSKLTENRNQ